jgi:hypothetical protein
MTEAGAFVSEARKQRITVKVLTSGMERNEIRAATSFLLPTFLWRNKEKWRIKKRKTMNVNYIKHLEAVTMQMAEDTRLNTSHVSMYLALFLIWNHNRFQNPLSINRSEVMKISKIGARATYHKCITELHQWGYLKYIPSHNPLKGSLIYLFNFGTSSEQVVSQPGGQLPSQVLGPSINNKNKTKHTNISKGESHSPEKKKNSTAIPSSSKTHQRFVPPSNEEVKSFFLENKSGTVEAEKFFNHFESNGWLVGGKSKMKNWQAAARNWILNSEKFNTSSNGKPKPGNLNVNQNKDYSIPL